MTPFEGLQALGQWGQAHPQIIWGSMGGALLLGMVLRVVTGGHRRRRDMHGSARWSTYREVKRSGLSRTQGVVVGVLREQTFFDNGPKHVFLCGPTRCHGPGTAILMADGQLKNIEDLQAGEKVMGPDSLPRTLLETHQGRGELVKICPSKGEAFVVTMDHLLSLRRTSALKRSWRRKNEIVHVAVRDWMSWSHTQKWIHKLYRVEVEFPRAAPLPMHPYLLGILLGDGSFGYSATEITNPDAEIRREVERIVSAMGLNVVDRPASGGGCPRYAITQIVHEGNWVRQILKSLALHGCVSGTKFIPQLYKTASRDDRRELLAGLLDTDGHYNGRTYTYSSKSKLLATDIAFLARSLGYAAYIRPQIKKWQNGCGLYFSVEISGALSLIPCRISRKQAKPSKRHWSVQHVGFHVEPVGHGPFYGFTCDGDHRYVMGDFTVTHNSNKGVCHIQPTLQLGWRHSALILDPKRGENYDLTHTMRQQYGRVEAFTPYASPQAKLNVLDTIRLRTLAEHGDALTIAQSLTAPYKMVQENSTSLHFRELAAMLLTAALLHVCYTATRASLASVWAFLTQQHQSLGACLQTMRGTRHTPYGVHPTIGQFVQAIRNITGDRELSSVWTTVVRPLSLYADPLIAASTDTSTVDLEDLQHGPEPLSLYLLAPSPRSLERLHPVYRVIIDVAMARLTDRPVSATARRLLVCAEELPAYGYVHALNKGASDMAGYGIKGFFVAQDLDQFEDVYGAKNTIWGNTETKIFHAPDNERTAERVSRFILGAATVANPVSSRQGFLRDGSVSYQHVERPLMTTDEVQGLDPAQMIVRRTGSKPMLLYKLGYDPEKREAA